MRLTVIAIYLLSAALKKDTWVIPPENEVRRSANVWRAPNWKPIQKLIPIQSPNVSDNLGQPNSWWFVLLCKVWKNESFHISCTCCWPCSWSIRESLDPNTSANTPDTYWLINVPSIRSVCKVWILDLRCCKLQTINQSTICTEKGAFMGASRCTCNYWLMTAITFSVCEEHCRAVTVWWLIMWGNHSQWYLYLLAYNPSLSHKSQNTSNGEHWSLTYARHQLWFELSKKTLSRAHYIPFNQTLLIGCLCTALWK